MQLFYTGTLGSLFVYRSSRKFCQKLRFDVFYDIVFYVYMYLTRRRTLSLEDYYKLYNNAVICDYSTQKEQIQELIIPEAASNERASDRFIREAASFLRLLILFEEKSDDAYYRSASLAELAADQEKLYAWQGSRYDSSLLNPSVSRKSFGPAGAVVSALGWELQKGIRYAVRHMRFGLSHLAALFLEAVPILKASRISIPDLSALLEKYHMQYLREEWGLYLHTRFSIDQTSYEERIEKGDLSDPGFLYGLGQRVTATDLDLAAYINSLDNTTIDLMARSYVQAYRQGFFADGKDILRKKTVGIYYPLGMERFTRRLMELFRTEIHYIPFIIGTEPSFVNRQAEYDHRFDNALYLTEEYVNASLEALRTELEQNAEMLSWYGGPAYIDSFGAPDFTPVQKRDTCRYTEAQQELLSRFTNEKYQLLDKYIAPAETSFCMAAYPIPSIGPDFPEIFRETVRINTLDNRVYQKAQQALADALDQGVAAEIRGAEGNDTALTVILPPIEKPAAQTNFYNCVADVNIPLGEVFTSPVLAGTNGTLHTSFFYWDGLLFKDLKIRFENGCVADYGCGNFSDPEEGRRFVYENLLMPHASLPLGEFAIGTNTYVYRLASRYGIAAKLPVLIIEKMGPHFAIGDTCYVGTEDLKIYNPMNGKEIVARENERTMLRKTDPAAAYTGKHIDITLPYSDIASISVRKASGDTVDLIRNGRFVLPGTAVLNEGLDLLAKETTAGSNTDKS